MRKIILLKGLPASGKSTRAREYLDKNPGTKRVNKDDLRAMLDNSVRSKENEKFVLEMRNDIIRNALMEGKTIVVDDTNFSPEHERVIKHMADLCDASFETRFFDTPLEECILRDSKREKSVGEKVIRDMYERYLKPNQEEKKFEMKPGGQRCVLFDIDGTLALMKDRSPYDWSRVGEDEVNRPILEVYYGYKIRSKIIVSGRDSICRKETEEWLAKHGIEYDRLYMRPQGDTRKDAIIKREFLDDIVKDYFVTTVFDDRNQVVKMWRSLGLTCLQVAEGDF